MSQEQKLKAYRDCFADAIALAIAVTYHDGDTAQHMLDNFTEHEARCTLNALSQIVALLARQVDDDHPDRESILRILGHVNSTDPPKEL